MKLENDIEKGIDTGLILFGFIVGMNYWPYPLDLRLILPFLGIILIMRNIWKK